MLLLRRSPTAAAALLLRRRGGAPSAAAARRAAAATSAAAAAGSACTGSPAAPAITSAVSGPKDLPKDLRLAIVGDVHDAWSEADAAALAHLSVDFTLFVGDFGNENVPVVAAIAALPDKAALLGNHDAWYSMSRARREKKAQQSHPATMAGVDLAAPAVDRVAQQLALLGDAHVGFRSLDVPGRRLSVVGARRRRRLPRPPPPTAATGYFARRR